MNTDKSKQELEQLIKDLEYSLLEQSARQSQTRLNQLIADDFVEFGSSGAIYTKQDILDALPSEEARALSMSDFSIKELSQEVVLALYRIIETVLFR